MLVLLAMIGAVFVGSALYWAFAPGVEPALRGVGYAVLIWGGIAAAIGVALQ